MIVETGMSTAPTGQPPRLTSNFIAAPSLFHRAVTPGHAGLAPGLTETVAAVLVVAGHAWRNTHSAADATRSDHARCSRAALPSHPSSMLQPNDAAPLQMRCVLPPDFGYLGVALNDLLDHRRVQRGVTAA